MNGRYTVHGRETPGSWVGSKPVGGSTTTSGVGVGVAVGDESTGDSAVVVGVTVGVMPGVVVLVATGGIAVVVAVTVGVMFGVMVLVAVGVTVGSGAWPQPGCGSWKANSTFPIRIFPCASA